MARVAKVDMSEVDGLARDLEERPAEVRRAVSEALTASINRIYNAASAAAPVDQGELRDSIRKSRPSGLDRSVWSSTRQGIFQEFGTSLHPPQPWLTPARDAEVPRFVRALEDIVSEPL